MNKEEYFIQKIEERISILRDDLQQINNSRKVLNEEYFNITEFQKFSTERTALGGMQNTVSCHSPYSDVNYCNSVNDNIRKMNDKRSALDKKIAELKSDINSDSEINNKLEQKKQEIAAHESIMQEKLQELKTQEELLKSIYEGNPTHDIDPTSTPSSNPDQDYHHHYPTDEL